MQYDIRYGPAYALAIIYLDAGDQLQAETGAMVSMADTIKMQTGTRGGLMAGLRRSMLGGESFFINTFKATGAEGHVTLAPKAPGDIRHHAMSGNMLVQSGSYIASSPSITVDTKWGGAKTFFSGEGLFMLHCSGAGDLLMSSYGAIHEVQLQAGEVYTVDTSHIVAFPEGVQYEVVKVGNWRQTLTSGEGLVCKLTGPGTIYLQTRSPQALADFIYPMLPKPSN